jgi:hypothetical protein
MPAQTLGVRLHVWGSRAKPESELLNASLPLAVLATDLSEPEKRREQLRFLRMLLLSVLAAVTVF